MDGLLTLAQHEAKCKELEEKIAKLDLSKEDDSLDYEKLGTHADLEGDTPEAKMESYRALLKESNDAKAAWDKAIDLEKQRRQHEKNKTVNVITGLEKDGNGNEKHESFKEAIREAYVGKDANRDPVRVDYDFGGDWKALFSLTNPSAAAPPGSNYEIFETRLGRIDMLLSMFQDYNLVEGDTALFGIDLVEGGEAGLRGRAGGNVSQASNTATADIFPVYEVSVGQDIPRVLARDHGRFLSTVGETLVKQDKRKLWKEIVTGTGANNRLTGLLVQITQEPATDIPANTKIIKYFEDEIENMRIAGCDPSVALCAVDIWSTLRDAYRNLNYQWSERYNEVNMVPFVAAPDLAANTVIVGDFNYAQLGSREQFSWESNPYTSRKAGAVYVDAFGEFALALWQTGGVSPQFKKYLTAKGSNNLIA